MLGPDPAEPQGAARRGAGPTIERGWIANLQVYDADNVSKQMKRDGVEVARCTVERLVRRLGRRGAWRGKVVRTTSSDNKAACPLDKVNREFEAERPNQLWGRTSPMSRRGMAGST